MANKELLDIVHRHLYTRKLDIETGKPVIDRELEVEFLRVIKDNNEKVIKNISASNSQYFHVMHHSQGDVSLLTHNVKMVSCLFPKKLIITSFVRQGAHKYLLASIYDRFRMLIENDIAELYIDTDTHEIDWSPEEMSSEASLSQTGNVYLLTQSFDEIDYNGTIKVSLPWLENARPEDYVEIINKYQLQYDIYCRQIDRLSKIAKNAEELTNSFVKEVEDSFIDIRIALEKAQFELSKKGIKTAIGVVVTAIPFFIPAQNAFVSPEVLSSILGASSMITTVPPVVDSVLDYKNIGKNDNPYWLLWKWNKMKK